MALDRQSIQRKDFPQARRGYDPGEVDAHLAAIADELEASPGSGERHGSLASSAGERVRAIVEAAETTAAQIRREAEQEAAAIRRRATEHAHELSSSTTALRERLEATRRELDALIESMRGDGAALDEAPSEPVARVESVPAGTHHAEPQTHAEPVPAAAEPPPDASGDHAPEAPAAGEGDDEHEGARLVALNMALNQTPRDEIAKYLSEHYRLADRDQLLDDVYASIGG